MAQFRRNTGLKGEEVEGASAGNRGRDRQQFLDQSDWVLMDENAGHNRQERVEEQHRCYDERRVFFAR